MRLLGIGLAAGLSALGCEREDAGGAGGMPKPPPEGDMPHWAIVGIRFGGAAGFPAQDAPPKEVLRVPANQPLTLTVSTITADYCHGEPMAGEPPCCVSNHEPRVNVSPGVVRVVMKVELAADAPCFGADGPAPYEVQIPALAEGDYALIGTGREDKAIADLVVQLSAATEP